MFLCLDGSFLTKFDQIYEAAVGHPCWALAGFIFGRQALKFLCVSAGREHGHN